MADSSRRKRSSGEREASAISALMSSSMDGRRPLRRGRAVLLPYLVRGNEWRAIGGGCWKACMGDMKVRIAMAGRFIVDVFLFCLLCFRVLQKVFMVHGN